MLLSVRTRQKYLKMLGIYDGKIDGKEGRSTKAAYKALQNKYFTRSKDKDGVYGINTDILLRNAYRVETYTRNFNLEEFKCECGGRYCTGYPVRINMQLLKNVQALRTKFGPMTITSGLRCKGYNNSLVGSSSTSAHMTGKAVDFANEKTNTLSGRRTVMYYWKKLTGAGYTYCNENGNYPNMGNAVHVQVK